MKKIIIKKFSINECKNFSKRSGDLNILHLDKNIKKISQFDKPVVQGILILEFIFKKNYFKKILEKATSINIVFKKPVFVGETINFYLINSETELIIKGSNVFQEKIFINVEFQDKKKCLFVKNSTIEKFILKLLRISKKVGNYKKNLNLISNISLNKGSINENNIIKLSNNLYKHTNSNKELLIRTFFLSFEKKFKETFEPNSKIKINKKKFENKKILIIGGSSGLGKILTSYLLNEKINVDFTYNKNLDSAKKIQKRFRISNNQFFHLNEKKLKVFEKKIVQYRYIYYFPTPKIFNLSEKYFDYERFNEFNSINISFLIRIINLLSKSSQNYTVYIPSTKLIKNFEDNIEYNSSKLMQEIILKKIHKTFKNIKIINPRLDSFLTRSTKGLLNNKIGYDDFLKSAIDL